MVLVFFVAAGEVILTVIDSQLSAFQIAGGIVLFLFALSMIFCESKPEKKVKMAATENDTAIFPLAVLSIASPDTMLAAVLLTENNRCNLWEQTQTTAVMLARSIDRMGSYDGSELGSSLARKIGNSGTSIISRVMGLILPSVAVSSVLAGIGEYFVL